MKITKEELNLEEGLKKEWIITNGIGGFSSSTVIRSQYEKVSWITNCPINTSCQKVFDFVKIR